MSHYYDEGGRVEDRPLGREGYAEAETMHTPPLQHYPPQGYPPPQGYGYGYGRRGFPRLRRQYPIETKPFFLTSEFAALVVAVIALAITAGTSATVDAWRFWLLTTVMVSAYLLSRGIAKSGTRSNASDPREQMNLSWPRGGNEHERQ